MRIASAKSVIKGRMDRFLWEDRRACNRLLRLALKNEFLPFDRVAIVGGMVRDMARAGPAAFRSDVDLVLEASTRDVASFASRHDASPNAFGGYSMRYGPWKIDFWALETTWASRAGHVSVKRVEDMVGCTFFDWDSVIYDLKERSVHYRLDYLAGLRTGVLDIVLAPTPSPLGNLYRAAKRLLQWDLRAGPKLAAFIEVNLDPLTFDQMRIIEREKRGGWVLNAFSTAESLKIALLDGDRPSTVAAVEKRQISLPLAA